MAQATNGPVPVRTCRCVGGPRLIGGGGCVRCGRPVARDAGQHDEPCSDPGLERLYHAVMRKRAEMGLPVPGVVTGRSARRRG